jgi:methyltransferase (TIGR00027 family)
MEQRGKERASGTAAGVAMLRSIEAERPEAERICCDPYASAMANKGIGAYFSKLIIQSGLYELISPGAMSFVVGRERYIDDYLIDGLRDGLDQVVLLGAGFDTRAYRIPGIEKTRVFEIDQPATQELKLERLKKIVDPLPGHVIFVPMDFNKQMLGERLTASGYNERGKTLFVWQGVTYFLTARGVDGTLAFIANQSGVGSSLVFDYFYNEALRDTTRLDLKLMRRAARLTGEEYLFGIDEGGVEEFLAERGFSNVRNVTFADLKPVYFTGANAGRKMPRGLAIVSAKVARSAN